MGKKIQCIGRYKMDGIVLGKGNFAYVELATHEVTKVKVAIKIIDTRKIKDEYVRANLHREARIMTALHHPNVVRLYETLKATTLYCLVTEFASGGELLSYIKTQKDCRLPEGAARPFIRQLVSAIHYLHERNIVHRDLKMENIMLDEKQRNVKLIDFGLSNVYKEDRLRTHCGSPEYAAPELFVVGRTYGPEIDIWSLGIITFAMVLGRLPFFTPHHDEYHRQRMLQQIQKGLSAIHDRQMQTLSADCRNLLHQLIEPNPELRIPLAEIELHPWLTKNGKHPFMPYVATPRNKNLRNQVVAELAELMEMKKGVVNETVKENRADELSAMFNMMMNQRRKELGLMDYDHNRRQLHNASCSGAQQTVGDGGKSQGPDGSRLRTPVTRSAQPFRKREAAAQRSRSGSARPKNRSQSIGGDPMSPNSRTREVTSRSSRIDGSRSGAIPNEASPCAIHYPSKDRTSLFPGGSMTQPSNAPTQPNGPSRIPVMPVARARAAKLSLTLDLSVVNPGDGAHRSQAEQEQLLARRREAISDCSYGIAASSGVPPQMSPNVASKETGANSGGSDSAKGKPQSKPRASNPPRKARRPSSLQYSLRLNPPKLMVHADSTEPSTAAEATIAPVTSSEKLVAPKATPEDSLIDSCCSSISEEPSTGFLDERPSPDALEGSVGAGGSQIDRCLCALQGASIENPVIESVIVDAGLNQESSDSKAVSLCSVERFSLRGGSTNSTNESRRTDCTRLSRTSQCSSSSDAKLLRISDPVGYSDRFLESQYHQLNFLNTMTDDGSKDTWRLMTTIRGSDELSSSSHSIMTDQRLRCGSIGDAHDFNQWSSISLCQHGQPSETTTLVAEAQEPGTVNRASVSDGSSGRLSTGIGRGNSAAALSPESPVWAQSRFSHIGSHALDVFFSPEEISPTEPLWRPVVATTMRGSPTDMGSSSSDPFDVDVPGGGCCSEFPTGRTVSAPPPLTASEALASAASESETGLGEYRRSGFPFEPSLRPRLCPSFSSTDPQASNSSRGPETAQCSRETANREQSSGDSRASNLFQKQQNCSNRSESHSAHSNRDVRQSVDHSQDVTHKNDDVKNNEPLANSNCFAEESSKANQGNVHKHQELEQKFSPGSKVTIRDQITRDCLTGNLKSGSCPGIQKKGSTSRHLGAQRLRWYDQSYPTQTKDSEDRKEDPKEDNQDPSSELKSISQGSSKPEALQVSNSGMENQVPEHAATKSSKSPGHRRSHSEIPRGSTVQHPDHHHSELQTLNTDDQRPLVTDLPVTSEKLDRRGRNSKEQPEVAEQMDDARGSVAMATRRRIPVLSSLLRDKKKKRDQCDGKVPATTTTTTTTISMTVGDAANDSDNEVRSSGSIRHPTWRQGLSRLFQISRTPPATSDRNSNNICHPVIAPPFSGTSFKSKLRLAAQTDEKSSSCEVGHAKANHRRSDDGGGALKNFSVPPIDMMGTNTAPPNKVQSPQNRRKVEGVVSFDDAQRYTANRDEWAGIDLTRANSIRSNHCRINTDAGDNNGNTAVPRVDWSGTEKTSGVHQETSYQAHKTGSLKICRTSSKRNSSRLKMRRLDWSCTDSADKRPESENSAASDNTSLRKVLPASRRSTVVDSARDAETRKT